MKLTIGHLYPDLLNLYGDRGNLLCLVKRLQWRGIEAEVVPLPSDRPVDFSRLDLVLFGGGSDREQELACRRLPAIRAGFQAFVEDYGVTLAVCGGYQLMGLRLQTARQNLEGLGILDIVTAWEAQRLVHDIVVDSPLFLSPVTGFENHGGRTDIKNGTPLGRVGYGMGNTGRSGYEGLVYKNVIATYLHGPLLPKNPEVCDYLLAQALRRRYDSFRCLLPLPDQLEKQANTAAATRILKKRYIYQKSPNNIRKFIHDIPYKNYFYTI